MVVSARQQDPCLDESELLAFADGRGSVGRPRDTVEAHVAECSECRTLLSALAQSASIVQVKSGTGFAATEFSGHATMRLASEPPPASASVGAARGSVPPVDPATGALVNVGDILDLKYRVQGVLGVGGMGIVVSAYHLALGQSFAIKFLHPHIARQGEAKARFLREARAAAQLRGEHVVRVTDTGTLQLASSPDVPFLVMELLDGQSLGTLLRTGHRLSPNDAVLYMLQTAEALAEAHRLGMVHRDVKPDNLFLARRADGTVFVKVVDFGISKTRADDALSLTSKNAIMGTPRYMAPEQMRNTKDVDARADVWSLGAVLYELLASVPPFDATSITEIITQVQISPHVPLATRAPGLPAALVDAVEGCLQKDPLQRIPDVLTLARILRPTVPREGWVHIERIERLLGGAPQSHPPPSAFAVEPAAPLSVAPARMRLWPIAAGALVAGLVLGAVLIAAFARTSAPPQPQQQATVVASTSGSSSSLPSLASTNEPLPPASFSTAVSLPGGPARSAPRSFPGARVTLTAASGAMPNVSPSAPTSSALPTPLAPSADPHGLRSRN